jgi:DNA-binding transcriptional MerR regulator
MAFTIRELELLSGIKAHTIRIWEQRYNFLKPSRTQTNIRTYNNEELKTLLTVALLNKFGYKISLIDEMDNSQRAEAILKLYNTDALKENLVNRLIGFMIDLNSHEFECLINEYLNENGLENTLQDLIYVFLERVGILWQTNRIIPLQEHIVSNIIRQKIISAIELLKVQNSKNETFLLFLPEDEHHEVGLLFIYYLLKKMGYPVIYLGASVPLPDIEYLYTKKKPSYIYLHLTSFPSQYNIFKFFNSLHLISGDSKILISGSVAENYKKPLPDNFICLNSIQEFEAFIDKMENYSSRFS